MLITGMRVLGILLIAMGITFFIWGMNVSEGFEARFMKQMAGEYPEEARRYIFNGVIMTVLGASLLVTSFFKRIWRKRK